MKPSVRRVLAAYLPHDQAFDAANPPEWAREAARLFGASVRDVERVHRDLSVTLSLPTGSKFHPRKLADIAGKLSALGVEKIEFFPGEIVLTAF